MIPGKTLTPALAAWLASAHDDDAEPLHVEQDGADIRVARQDGADLSAEERVEVAALCAAHAAEPLGPRRR